MATFYKEEDRNNKQLLDLQQKVKRRYDWCHFHDIRTVLNQLQESLKNTELFQSSIFACCILAFVQ